MQFKFTFAAAALVLIFFQASSQTTIRTVDPTEFGSLNNGGEILVKVVKTGSGLLDIYIPRPENPVVVGSRTFVFHNNPMPIRPVPEDFVSPSRTVYDVQSGFNFIKRINITDYSTSSFFGNKNIADVITLGTLTNDLTGWNASIKLLIIDPATLQIPNFGQVCSNANEDHDIEICVACGLIGGFTESEPYLTINTTLGPFSKERTGIFENIYSIDADQFVASFPLGGVSARVEWKFGADFSWPGTAYAINYPTNFQDIGMVVRPSPIVFENYEYCKNTGIKLLNASPAGGVWSGSSYLTTDGNYNTDESTIGGHDVKYTFTSPIGGCISEEETSVNITSLPTVTAGNVQRACKGSGLLTLNGASPSGGTWSGSYVSGDKFDTDNAPAGDYTITYTASGSSACFNSNTKTVTIYNKPTVDVGEPLSICENSGDVELTATPANGTWSGPGVSGNTFTPTAQGTFQLVYTYMNEMDCESSAIKTIVVRPSANTIVDAGLPLETCAYGNALILQGATPSGGVWSGPGVANGRFTPSVDGTFYITYSYLNPSGCTITDTREIIVNPSTRAEAGNNLTVCVNEPDFDLANFTPISGTWSGKGFIGPVKWSPKLAGVGRHKLVYTISSTNCLSLDSIFITVENITPINIGTNKIFCSNDLAYNLNQDLDLVDRGGVWSGQGVTGINFDPKVNQGSYLISYKFTNENGCVSTKTKEFTVVNQPTVLAGPNTTTCLNAQPINLLGNFPTGGQWTGPGVNGSTFNPLIVGEGSHTITYRYTNPQGCSNTATKNITVSTPAKVDPGQNIFTCVTGDLIDLNETTSQKRGVWSGVGVTSNIFSPSSAAEGSYSLTLTVVDDLGCTSSASKIVTVLRKLLVDSGPDLKVCSNAGLINLMDGVSNNSGSWTGSSVTGAQFEPAIGQGKFTLTYTLAPKYGCSATDTRIIEVVRPGSATIGPDLTVCKEYPTINLTTNVVPAGGQFFGAGVVNNTFSPSLAGTGAQEITYVVNDANNCLVTKTRTITIAELAPIVIGPELNFCLASSPVDLIKDVKLYGGVFIGDGIQGSIFTPSLAGLGSHVITYEYSNRDGCKSTGTRVITVQNDIPVYGGLDLSLCNSVQTFDLTGHGTTPNGKYIGEGIKNNVFNPSLTGIGSFPIKFVVDNGNGCISQDELVIEVKPSTIKDFGKDTILCITSPPMNLNFSSELTNGTWSGNGVVTNYFYPALTEKGTHQLSYYISTLECDIAGRRNVTVTDLPQPATSQITNVLGCVGSFAKLNAKVDPKDRINNVNIGWFRESESRPFTVGENISFQISGNEQIYYKAINGFGCSSGQNDYIRIETDNPSGDFKTETPTAEFGRPVLFSGVNIKNASSYKWNFGDGLISYEKDPYHYYYESGPFDVTLTLTSSTGCITTLKKEGFLNVKVEPGRELTSELTSGRIESFYPRVISYSPNPTSGVFNIELQSTPGNYKVEAVDYVGNAQVVGNYLIENSNENILVDISNLKAGLYLIVVQGENQFFKFKIIKQ